MTTAYEDPAQAWYGPVIPARETCVLKYVLESRAAQTPNKLYVEFEDGTRWTYSETWNTACQTAACLAALGLVPGDVVFVWLPNGPEFLKIWFGANLLGVIVAAPNIGYRGGVLQHLFSLAEAKIAIVHNHLLEHLRALDLGKTQKILTVGAIPAGASLAVEILSFDHLPPVDLPRGALAHVVEPWHTQFIIFTSGTTGPSKGVIVPYVQMHAISMTHYEGHLDADDRYLVNMPLFHISGLLPAYGAMLTGGAIVVIAQFKTDTFWDVIRKFGITGCTMIGAAANDPGLQFKSAVAN